MATYSDSKPHYDLLDGLRGVAALMVMWFHIFEGYATSPFDQKFNHGYLAVDFFFILSGFVIGYAYDDRWKNCNNQLTLKEFAVRRLVRLHPMIIMGAIIGGTTFIVGGSLQWDGTHIALSATMLAVLCTMFLIPTVPGTTTEIRGNGEMYPVNGPMWSLFFEYIGNILYALFIRRVPTKALAILTSILGVLLGCFAIGNFSGSGSIGVGWSMIDYNLPGGLLRMMFSYSAGMLLARLFAENRKIKLRGAFWICAAAIVAVVSMPHIGGESAPWMNGIYDTLCVAALFPLIVWIAASGTTTNGFSAKMCRWLGDISYPLYVVQYPFMYLFYAWLWKDGIAWEDSWYVALGVYLWNIVVAYACLRFYDAPLRRYLARKWIRK